MQVILCWDEADRVVVDAGYDAKLVDLLKYHGCWWDRAAKVWVVRVPTGDPAITKYLHKKMQSKGVSPIAAQVRRIVKSLVDAGYTVSVDDPNWVPATGYYTASLEEGGATRF